MLCILFRSFRAKITHIGGVVLFPHFLRVLNSYEKYKIEKTQCEKHRISKADDESGFEKSANQTVFFCA